MPCYFSNLVVLADYKSRSLYKYTELSFKKPSKCYNHLSFLILRMFYGFFCYCFLVFFLWWNVNIVVLIDKTKTMTMTGYICDAATLRLFRIMSIATTLRLFLVLTSEQIGWRLPMFTLLLWQRQHIIVVDALDYKYL